MNKARFSKFLESVKEGGAIMRGEIEPSRIFERESPRARRNPPTVWAVCVTTDDDELVVPFKIYQVQPLGNDAVCVIDETGEAAIYPADSFLRLSLSPTTQQQLADYRTRLE